MNMTTRLEIRPISELIPYANNARTHSPEQIDKLRRSLREFGFVSPVLIDAAGAEFGLTPSGRRSRGLIPPR